jgi:hypothetical protein
VVLVGGITRAALKTALVTLYPGADGGKKRYTANNLDDLVASQVVKCVTTTTDFFKYHCTFKKILQHLTEKGKMSELEGRRLFMKGLKNDFKEKLLWWIQIVHHDRPNDMPYLLSEMSTAAEYILDGPPLITNANDDTSLPLKRRWLI